MIEPIVTNKAPKPGNYSQGIKVDVGPGYLIYVSGQTGNVITGNQEVITDRIYEQTEQALRNIEGVIREVGGSRKNIIDITAFLTDLKQQKQDFELAYSRFFGKSESPLPARALVQVSRIPLVTENCLVELKATAFVPKR
ncbi:MAG: RidA family protein [Nanoarchaeota archaeon]